ncbi:phosphatase PAP2 family protein [Cytophagaceae bacterium YF14B1]|uniref:Phosphatase PAP2 family protein n=1 Tax=Xanthocytophaga flava TaxID=3048013 RepID=A0AAE3QPQ4_9BACT|nr:phosphatase PAP2 family protein [Xanthocytophaga flavus]MDJ1481265.1 phosphatase PAP2 family protein [Xanthocytophaga flavus]
MKITNIPKGWGFYFMLDNQPDSNDDSAHSLITRAKYIPSELLPVRKTSTGRAALVVSILLHPLLLPTYLFLLLFWMSPSMMGVSNDDIRYRILLLLIVCTLLIPLLSTYMLYRLGSVKSLHMEDRQDRVFPFVSTTLFYMLTTYLFVKQLSALYLITLILGGTTFCLLVMTVISFFWKISVHSTSIAGIVGFLIGLYYHYAAVEYFYPLLLVIILAGVLMSARLYLNAHTPAQVLAGAAVGLSIGLGTILMMG